ncbi:hypothetical protein [Variovorax sp. dw_308]|uniref:hypothetical protein n=1 Tax=Variovorax sp. dw_308 TaxID=2721546 RepID=UPI00210C952A|nr:hypothetical protein [Variovorax sp. dw_308]
MSMLRCRQGLAAGLAALVLVGSLTGCAGEPTRLPLDSTRAETLQRLGPPTATYALADGGERLQYSRAPAGFEVNNVDLDKAGRVVSIRQELDEGLFGNTIQPGAWREPDVLRTYGRPFEISRVTSFDGDVWTWRYKWHNTIRLLYLYVDPQGVVDHYNVGDDLSLERRIR